jgi:anion-transporting  ArsA/GET3 family ATPase
MIGAEKECTFRDLSFVYQYLQLSRCFNLLIFFILAAVESKLLKARIKMQQKYIDQFHMLYDDFNITKLPLLSEEVSNFLSHRISCSSLQCL